MTPLWVLPLLLGSLAEQALCQGPSSSDSLYTIQTTDPFPSSTASQTHISNPTTAVTSSPSSGSASGSSTTSSASATITATGVGAFPSTCASQCTVIANALSTCGAASFNATCLCTVQIEQSYLQCVECAIAINPDPNSQTSYQALIDAYIGQCASATDSPTTLPNVTVTIPHSTSASSSVTSSMAITSSAMSSTTSSRVVSSMSLPTQSVSHPPLSSATSAAATATQTGAGRAGVDSSIGGSLGLGMVGVIIPLLTALLRVL